MPLICVSFSHQVNIQVPSPELQCDIISITGLANHLDRAREGLLERVKELQLEQEDRVSAGAPCWRESSNDGSFEVCLASHNVKNSLSN